MAVRNVQESKMKLKSYSPLTPMPILRDSEVDFHNFYNWISMAKKY